MRVMPKEYHGREQTWLKHRVLEEYLAAWSHKLGSVQGREVHLWFVDVFAGPWQSQSVDRRDTSIAIGLGALNDAATTWGARGHRVHLHAVFVEKNPRAYAALREFVEGARGEVDTHTLLGAFGDHVTEVDRLVGPHPAFIFVDPTGWDGAALRYIVQLARGRFRDVLINVMYDHINRFKDDERAFLREQMREFFGLPETDLPPGLDEDALMSLYRARLRDTSGVPWVADLAVPVPTRDRTKFRLVVAGHHPKVVELFRDVEAQVIGREAAMVRTEARVRESEGRTGQLALLAPVPPAEDAGYAVLRVDAARDARSRISAALAAGVPRRWGDLWPALLCELHLRHTELRAIVGEMERAGEVDVRGKGPRVRTVKDEHVLVAVRS